MRRAADPAGVHPQPVSAVEPAAAVAGLGTAVLDASGCVLALDAGARRLIEADGEDPDAVLGGPWGPVAEAATGWLTSRREACPTASGSLVLVHLAAVSTAAPAALGPPGQTWLEAALECLDTGVLALDSTMRPVVINAALRRLHGHDGATPGGFPGRPELFLPDGSTVPDDQRLIARALASGAVRGVRLAVRNERTGELRQVSANAGVVPDAHGAPIGIVVAVHDVHETVCAQAALEHLAFHDALTGLLNRRGFAAALADRPAGRGAPAVLVCDVDGFKAVNDRFGHAVGDLMLCDVAAALEQAAGAAAVVARLGGDEFAVVDPADPAGFLADVRRRLAGPSPGRPVPVLSFGVAVPGQLPAGATLDELLRHADHQMYALRRARRASPERARAD